MLKKWWLLRLRDTKQWRVLSIPTVFGFPLTNFRCRTVGPFDTKEATLSKADELNGLR